MVKTCKNHGGLSITPWATPKVAIPSTWQHLETQAGALPEPPLWPLWDWVHPEIHQFFRDFRWWIL